MNVFLTVLDLNNYALSDKTPERVSKALQQMKALKLEQDVSGVGTNIVRVTLEQSISNLENELSKLASPK